MTRQARQPPRPEARATLFGLVLVIHVVLALPARAGVVADTVQAFATSEIEFQRGGSRVPFPPMAFVDLQRYSGTDLARPAAGPVEVDQLGVSQAALLPFLLGSRDALIIGEWVSWSRFSTADDALDDFDVVSVAVPVGWLRQVSPSWQVAAFAMPLGHKADLPRASWTWETMGGVFGRRIQSDDVWWAAGLFADVGAGEDLYLPYVGASWSVNDAWTLSAVLPWPAVLWAPTDDLLFRLGASPSGTSWALDSEASGISVDLSSLDLGLSAERHLTGSFWARLEFGVGGFRALRLAGDEWQSPDAEPATAPYVSIGINLRPSLPGP